jgi:murein DD-endopeptidase MepM/ murein hydrolase activator NlpD
MGYREQHRFVDASGDIILEVSRGHRRRRYRLSPGLCAAGGGLVLLFAAAVLGAAGYLMFHDRLLAGLIERQTRMQYAYEDRIAALRLRLDQLASRQIIDQDGVEGKVQSLVLRQAQLETRAAVVARLVEGALARDAGVTMIAPTGRAEGRAAKGPAALAGTVDAGPHAVQAPAKAAEPAKPEPEGLELRLGDEPKPVPLPPPPATPKRERVTPVDVSFAAPDASMAEARDPGAPLPVRLERLALSLDRVEREQTRRLSGILRPAMEEASRLREAFDMAGVPVERLIGGTGARDGGKPRRREATAVGGPFVAAPAAEADGLFERHLAAAQTAVATLDGLRRALPLAPLRKPLAGPLQLTSAFGYRTDPFFGRLALHSGVDLREEEGAQVRATAAGVVTVARPQGGYGNLVEIDHGGGMSTRYGHLSVISVTPGQQVSPGAGVGRVGSTGRSTGPHLHYEVRLDGEAVDPARFLRAASALGGVLQ